MILGGGAQGRHFIMRVEPLGTGSVLFQKDHGPPRFSLWVHMDPTLTLTTLGLQPTESSIVYKPPWKRKWSRLVMSNSLDPMDCSLPVSSIHRIFQARVLEWVAISFSRGSSRSRDRTRVSLIAGRCFTFWATREGCGLLLQQPKGTKALPSLYSFEKGSVCVICAVLYACAVYEFSVCVLCICCMCVVYVFCVWCCAE